MINLKNRGAGLPDGGLLTAKQLKKLGGDEMLRDPAAFIAAILLIERELDVNYERIKAACLAWP